MMEWCIVLACFMTVPLVEMTALDIPIDPRNLRFLRLVRVLRLLRAAKVFKFLTSVEVLADAIKRAVPSLRNMVLLLAVFYFCFGVMGVAFFGLMCLKGDESRMMRCLITSQHSRLEYSQSFQHMGTAFLTLFRLSSGDAWSSLLTKLGMSAGNFYRESNYIQTAQEALASFNTATSDFEMQEALRRLRQALPGCVTDGELQQLEDGVSIDCSIPNHCDSTCGSVVSFFFIPFFVVLTNNVVVKLVIPPLMIEIGRHLNANNAMPGTNKLSINRFSFIWTKWRRQSRAKQYVLWVEEHRKNMAMRAGGRRRSSAVGRTSSEGTMRRTSSAASDTGAIGRTHSSLSQDVDRDSKNMITPLSATHLSLSAHTLKLRPGLGTKYQGEVLKRGQLNPAYKRRFS
jgi:hypothetical protein